MGEGELANESTIQLQFSGDLLRNCTFMGLFIHTISHLLHVS